MVGCFSEVCTDFKFVIFLFKFLKLDKLEGIKSMKQWKKFIVELWFIYLFLFFLKGKKFVFYIDNSYNLIEISADILKNYKSMHTFVFI